MRKGGTSACGLDIGHHSIKAVVATANGQHLRVRLAEEVPLPLEASDLPKALSRWVEEQGLSRVPATVSVGGSRLLYQHVKMEEEDPRSFDQVARMEAMRFQDMTDAVMEVTATPASPLKQERNVLISMARSEHVSQALEPFVSAGIPLVNACPAPVALYNGFTSLGEPVHQPTLFVSLGAETTEMIVGDGQGVRFARSMAMGTALLTQALASREKLPFSQAERLRIQAASFADLPGEMPEVCAQFVRQWVQEIQAGLQLYGESPAGAGPREKIRTLHLSGGGAAWAPLIRELREQMSLSVTVPGMLPGLETVAAGPFLTACGLAADGLHLARAPSSLLVQEIRRSLSRQRNKRYWAMTGAFSLGALAAVGAATQISFNRERQELGMHNRTLQRSDAIRQESETLLARQRQVQQMMKPLADFVTNSSRVRDLTLRIAQEKGPEDFITFLGDSESYLQLRLDSAEDRERRMLSPRNRLALQRLDRQEAENLRSARMSRLIIEGFTPRKDLTTVKSLIDTLQELDAVEQADLLSDNFVFPDPERDAEWAATGYRRFVLDVRLRGEADPEEAAP